MKDQTNLNRREFLKKLGMMGAGLYLSACAGAADDRLPSPSLSSATSVPTGAAASQSVQTTTPSYGDTYLAVACGDDIAEMTRRALDALGGIARFVHKDADVIIKPNICTDYYSYEYGATTNPTVAAALISLALGAGAKRVRVMDNPFGGTAQSAYVKSGIQDAVVQAGGEMEIMNPNKFKEADIPDGIDIKKWIFYKDILDADLVIDVPIAKQHGTTGLTLGCKNLLGTVQNRGQIHSNIHQRIADLTSRVRPALTVVDAIRTLMRNGPTGGNLDDVKMTNTIIASADIVAADAYAATLFGMRGGDIGYIQAAADMGLGTLDLDKVKIEELAI